MNASTGSSKTEGTKTPPNWVFKAFSRLHVLLNRLTRGRAFNTLHGDEVCFVCMIGAKSGQPLHIPLMFVPFKQGVLLVASKGGAADNPLWYHNLIKRPDIRVAHRGKTMELTARLATKEEQDELWPICDSKFAPFAQVRESTDRDIPIFVCEPADSSTGK